MADKQEEVIDKQAGEQALPPQAPSLFKTINEIEETSKKSVDEIELSLNRERDILIKFSVSDEWTVVKKYINQMITNLKVNITPSPKDAISFEQIGMKFVIADQVEKALKDVINIVEAPKKQTELPQEDDKNDI